MNHKLVSVIIPTFNRASLVGEAIRSAQAQSYPAKQIIVVDDGSTDNTAQTVAQFEGIEYYRQQNKGQAAARNLGLRYAKGEYIASLDSDDVWNEEFLTDGINCLEKHELDFVFLNWSSSDGKENFLDFWERKKKWRNFTESQDNQWFLLNAGQARRLYLETCPSPSSSLLMRRGSMVSNWNEEMIIADDWFLILEMVLSKPCRAAFTLSPYWLKRVFDDNIYDGREFLEISKNLGLHDERLMAQRFNSQLTPEEKNILRERLIHHHLNFGRLSWKFEGISKTVLVTIAAAFALAPVGFGIYITKIFIDHLKNRRNMETLPNAATAKIFRPEED
ncbi:MAG TPA: glycosyltransferase family 2 protein [Pyrinomonadaceae bacterium]|nr:glycosyltransferase family 2 protein [Pyrinomonadaceae bacterium]